ncbi:hypothetical protein DFJ74DRAFT_694514 [Hyaloraphidium curvatum]|nr:hypothetical protein DFJ74DRAFT_694514 [Hyaloraphidium curvatum]
MAELTRMDPERPGMVLNGPIARKRSLQKLVAMIAEHESSLWKFDGSTELSRLQVTARTPPILIACDTDAYSRPEHAEVFRELRKFGFYDLHENEPLNIKSFHNFGGMKRVVRPHYIGRYDYILASPAIKRLSSRTIRERVRVQSKGGPPELRDYVREGYPSDHWPLIAEVEIGGRLAKM